MEPAVIAALISGACVIIAAVIAAIVSIYQFKKKKEEKNVVEVHLKSETKTEIPIPPEAEYPLFLNPDDYDIDEEDYFVTLGGLLQRNRNPKDISLKKLKNTCKGKDSK